MFITADRCMACHNGLIAPSGKDVSIGADWQSTMMANSSRDPYWQAAIRRETIDHASSSAEIQNECSACHMPMDRFQQNAMGMKGQVFAHLPFAPAPAPASMAAFDGVSCSVCHQIQPDGLGTRESFTAGFRLDTETQWGARTVYGPFDVDDGRRRVMRSSSGFVPENGAHMRGSELCGSCHTLITHTRGPGGEIIGELPEQVPYLEWQHSSFAGRTQCQSCHMPAVKEETAISSVLPLKRAGFARHAFRGGNFFMQSVLTQFSKELAVTAPTRYLDQAAGKTVEHLETAAARLQIAEASVSGDTLTAEIRVVNMAGHKLPTAYPSRRVWLHLTVSAGGNTVFESGALNADGSIAGNANDESADRFESHYEVITAPDEVQIYEAIMVGSGGEVTTGLLTAVTYVKDSRILPAGFDKTSAGDDIAVHGSALPDENFEGGSDRVRYTVKVDPESGPYVVEAELWYQPVGFRWAHNLGGYDTAESARFVRYYDSLSRESGVILARERVRLD